MTQFTALLFIITAICASNVSAQFIQKKEKVLFMELFVPDQPNGKFFMMPHKFVIPNDFDFENDFFYKAIATVDCIECPLTASYHLWIYKKEKIKNEQEKIGINLSFENKPDCNVKKEIKINQNKKETFNLKCGVRFMTYYAPDDEKS